MLIIASILICIVAGLYLADRLFWLVVHLKINKVGPFRDDRPQNDWR